MAGRFLFTIATLIVGLLLTANLAHTAEKFAVSIPINMIAPHLQAGRRITEFRITVSTGHVTEIKKIPFDWWVKVVPETPLKEQVEAFSGHGVSWLTLEDIQTGIFNEFLTVEIDRRFETNAVPELQADFSIDIPSEEEEQHVILEDR